MSLTDCARKNSMEGNDEPEWFDHDRKKRKDDRRFAGDGWEIDLEELKAWGKS